MSIECSNCNTINPENASFCNNCGEKLNKTSYNDKYQANTENNEYYEDFKEPKKEYFDDFDIEDNNKNKYYNDFKANNKEHTDDFNHDMNYNKDFEQDQKIFNNKFKTDNRTNYENRNNNKEYTNFENFDKNNDNRKVDYKSQKANSKTLIVDDNLPSEIFYKIIKSKIAHLLIFDLILLITGQFVLAIIFLGIIIFDYYN